MSIALDIPMRRRRTARRFRLTGLLGSSLVLFAVFAYSMMMLFIYSFYSVEKGQLVEEFTLATYADFLTDSYHWSVVGNTFLFGGVVTLICLLVGYPIAYALTKIRNPFLLVLCYVLIFSPVLVSVVVRAYGWLLLLSGRGPVNKVLLALGLVDEPVRLIFNFTGVVISMVHVLLAFMVFSILSVLRQQDASLKQAAHDLGANRLEAFVRVTLPLSTTGIVAGCQIVFVLTISAFVTPAVLGGGRVNLLAQGIYQGMLDFDWPLSAVRAAVLLLIVVSALLLLNRLTERLRP